MQIVPSNTSTTRYTTPERLILGASSQNDFDRIKDRVIRMNDPVQQRQYVGVMYAIFDRTVRQAQAARTAPFDAIIAALVLNGFIAFSNKLERTILSIESQLGSN
jgi:hypothetical protein